MQTLDEQLAHLPDIMTVQDVCGYLQIALRRGYRLVREKKIGSLRIGRMWRVPKMALARYIREELEYE